MISKQLNILYEFKTPIGYLGMGYYQQDLPHIFQYIQKSNLFEENCTVDKNCIKYYSSPDRLYGKLKDTTDLYSYLKDFPGHNENASFYLQQIHYTKAPLSNNNSNNFFSIVPPKEVLISDYFSRDLSELFSPSIIKFLQENKHVKVIFTDIWEGACKYEDSFFDTFYTFVSSYELDKVQVCFITNSFNIEDRYKKYLSKKKRVSFMTCKVVPFFFYGNNHVEHDEEKVECNTSLLRSKYYLNLNRNTGDRLHRADLVVGLIENGIFNKGLVSFHKSEGFDKFCNLKGNEKYKRLIGEKYPFTIDHKDPDLIAGLHPLHLDSPIKKTWTDTYFSVVSETSVEPTHAFITEKTVKPIYFFHPFIIWGNPYTLRYLREIGFKTFPEFFDESYDTVENTETRLLLILDNIKRLCLKDLSELHSMYKSVEPKLLHNYNLLKEMSTGTNLIDEFVDLWK